MAWHDGANNYAAKPCQALLEDPAQLQEEAFQGQILKCTESTHSSLV